MGIEKLSNVCASALYDENWASARYIEWDTTRVRFFSPSLREYRFAMRIRHEKFSKTNGGDRELCMLLAGRIFSRQYMLCNFRIYVRGSANALEGEETTWLGRHSLLVCIMRRLSSVWWIRGRERIRCCAAVFDNRGLRWLAFFFVCPLWVWEI